MFYESEKKVGIQSEDTIDRRGMVTSLFLCLIVG